MNIAYLILAHDSPRHLGRLIRAISSKSSSIFLHVDARSEMRLAEGDLSSVKLTRERVPVYWGDYSQVDATLALLRTAMTDAREFDYFVLLSGSHYPLRDAADIERFFERNAGAEFISAAPMGAPHSKPLSRLDIYRARPTDPLAIRAAVGLSRICHCPPRRDHRAYLGDIVPYGGCTWWALSKAACAHINDFSENETRIVNFFKHTRCPDESFFHTIIANSPYKSQIQSSLTYCDWSMGGASPEFITEKHLEIFRSERRTSLFARKFNDLAETVVAEIDRMNSGESLQVA